MKLSTLISIALTMKASHGDVEVEVRAVDSEAFEPIEELRTIDGKPGVNYTPLLNELTTRHALNIDSPHAGVVLAVFPLSGTYEGNDAPLSLDDHGKLNDIGRAVALAMDEEHNTVVTFKPDMRAYYGYTEDGIYYPCDCSNPKRKPDAILAFEIVKVRSPK